MSSLNQGSTPATFDISVTEPNGRLKVSNMQTIFDVDFEYSAQNARWETLVTNGSTVAQSPVYGGIVVNVPAVTNAVAIRQSKVYHRYQPGKGMYVSTAAVLGNPNSNVIKRVGIFDNSNGLFFEHSGTIAVPAVYAVQRSDAGGVYPVDTRVLQQNWNIDVFDGSGGPSNPSGILINWNSIQMLVIDYAWYGAGTSRLGFLINGKIKWGHSFPTGNSGATTAWSRTGNLPVRYEIRMPQGPLPSTGATIYHWGVSVVMEGKYDQQRGYSYAATNGTNLVSVLSGATQPVLSLRYYPMGVIQNIGGVAVLGVQSGGTGYAIGNKVALTGGTFGIAQSAIATVTGVSAGGVVTSVAVSGVGSYTVQPINNSSSSVNLSGSGSGLVFSTLPGNISNGVGVTAFSVNTTLSQAASLGTNIIFVTSSAFIGINTFLNIGVGTIQEFVTPTTVSGNTLTLSSITKYSHAVGETVTAPQTLIDTTQSWQTNTWAGRHIYFPGIGTYGYMARAIGNGTNVIYIEDAQLSDGYLGIHTYIPNNIGSGVTYQIGIIQRGQLWLNQLIIYSSGTCSFQVIYSTNGLGGAVTTSNWVNMSAIGSLSSLSQQDTSANVISGGETVFRAFTASGGSNVQQYDLTAMLPLNNTIYGNQPDVVSVVATPIGVGSQTLSATMVYFEAMA
jgi:hypothetical protein